MRVGSRAPLLGLPMQQPYGCSACSAMISSCCLGHHRTLWNSSKSRKQAVLYEAMHIQHEADAEKLIPSLCSTRRILRLGMREGVPQSQSFGCFGSSP